MANTVRVNDFNPLADHMTKLRNFTKRKNHDFSGFKFSLHLIFEQALSEIIVCLMISQKNYMKKIPQTSYHVAVDTR